MKHRRTEPRAAMLESRPRPSSPLVMVVVVSTSVVIHLRRNRNRHVHERVDARDFLVSSFPLRRAVVRGRSHESAAAENPSAHNTRERTGTGTGKSSRFRRAAVIVQHVDEELFRNFWYRSLYSDGRGGGRASGTLRKRPPVTWDRPGSRTSSSTTSTEAEFVELDRSFVVLPYPGWFDVLFQKWSGSVGSMMVRLKMPCSGVDLIVYVGVVCVYWMTLLCLRCCKGGKRDRKDRTKNRKVECRLKK